MNLIKKTLLIFIAFIFFNPIDLLAAPIQLGVMETTPVYVVAEWL